MADGTAAEPLLLYGRPGAAVEASWRRCLTDVTLVTHYVAPEFFDEPFPRRQKLGVLAFEKGDVSAVVTGLCDGRALRCGNAGRPQLVCAERVDQALAVAQLARGLEQLAAKSGAQCVDVFTWRQFGALRAHGFMERAEKGVVMLDLAQGPEALFRGFSDNKKTNIKKAIKKGVTVAIATDTNEWREYYRVYKDWSQRKRLACASEQEFLSLLSLTANRKLFVARHQGRIVAGVIVRFVPQGVVEFAANASFEDSLPLRPNDLLHWRIVEWAHAQGFPVYSLGGSHLFLRKFGGRIHPTFRYRLDRTWLKRYVLGHVLERALAEAKRALPPGVAARARKLRKALGPS